MRNQKMKSGAINYQKLCCSPGKSLLWDIESPARHPPIGSTFFQSNSNRQYPPEILLYIKVAGLGTCRSSLTRLQHCASAADPEPSIDLENTLRLVMPSPVIRRQHNHSFVAHHGILFSNDPKALTLSMVWLFTPRCPSFLLSFKTNCNYF